MSDLLFPPIPPESEQAAALRSEQAQILQKRLRLGFGTWITVGGWFLILYGYHLTQEHPGSAYVLLPGLGLVISIVGAGMEAMARGRHPAWGGLSMLSYSVLQLLPDLNAKRLDEIELALTGKLGSHVAKDRTNLAITVVVLVASKWWFLENNVNSQNQNHVENPAAGVSVEGRHSRLKLPAGWHQLPQPGNTDGLQADYIVTSTTGNVTVWDPFPKASFPNETLLAFAERFAKPAREADVTVKNSMSEATPLLIGGRSGVSFELQRKQPDGSSTVHLLCYWETTSHFWITEAMFRPESVIDSRREIHQLVGRIQIKHE